jgi:hypothetical protein
MILSPLRAAASPRTLVPQSRDAFFRAYRYVLKVYVAHAIALSAKAIVTAPLCDKNATIARESAEKQRMP